jgi:hypothetical protein
MTYNPIHGGEPMVPGKVRRDLVVYGIKILKASELADRGNRRREAQFVAFPLVSFSL